MTAATEERFAETPAYSGPAGIAGWMCFDWAAQPYYTLIVTFVFGPYFVNTLASDKVLGQAYWGYTLGAAAVMVAIGSPILGALADARGRLKPYIAWLSIVFVGAQAVLWYAPNAPHIVLVSLAIILAMMAAEYGSVLNNSLMPRIVPPSQLGRVSGTGWAIGYFGGLASLAVVAAFVLVNPLDPSTGKTMLGLTPLFSLDAAAHEQDRFMGPFAAAWYVLFVLPYFLLTPDAPAKPSARISLSGAFGALGNTFRNIGSYRDIVKFLIARMAFVDGLQAIFTFGGIYGTAVFAWGISELLAFGIIITLSGGVGALIGGFFDDRVGPKKVIIGALLILIVGALGVISIDASHVLFVVGVAPRAAETALLSSTGEIVFIAFAILIGLTSGPLQAASRSLLGRMAPPEQMSEFYGFFAFSGKATAFAAPTLVGIVTTIASQQAGLEQHATRIGMSTILLFLIAGLVLMSLVNTKPARRSA